MLGGDVRSAGFNAESDLRKKLSGSGHCKRYYSGNEHRTGRWPKPSHGPEPPVRRKKMLERLGLALVGLRSRFCLRALFLRAGRSLGMLFGCGVSGRDPRAMT